MTVNWQVVHNEINLLFQNPFFLLLIILVVVDFLTGTSKGILKKEVDSSTGLRGLIKHSMIILIVTVFSIVTSIGGWGSLTVVFILFYVFEYVVSIIENLDSIGIPFPHELRKIINNLQDKNNDKWGDK